MRNILGVLVALLFVSMFPMTAGAAQPNEVGIVLMHGFGLMRNRPLGILDPHRGTNPLAEPLRKEGYRIVQQEMPWGANRIIDASFDAAMEEIDGQVSKLKAEGAKVIIVAGHSMGAPMALAYAARRDGIAGVIGLAPGHHPELQPAIFPDFYPQQIAKAKAEVSAGKGTTVVWFRAANCCPLFFVDFRATPSIFLSYFDPDGPGTMAGNARNIKPGVPVLLVFGKQDQIFQNLEKIKESYADYVPRRLPPHPLHRSVIIDADHGQVPAQAIQHVVQWLRALP